MRCAPEDVFEVLRDGWMYATWVVGASRMRAVDADWPQPNSALHHSFGLWPALIDDTTVALHWAPPRSMVLRARGWPIGEARVTIQVTADDHGSTVRIDEVLTAGPARLVPRPLMDAAVRWRNAETLRRLGYIAEGRARARASR